MPTILRDARYAPTLDLTSFLETEREWIIGAAERRTTQYHLQRYEAEGSAFTKQRLGELLDRIILCLRSGSRAPMEQHAGKIATERFAAGFGLTEVQVAMNALEEALWYQIVRGVSEPAEHSPALGSVSSLLGFGKDVVARAYLSQAIAGVAPAAATAQ